MMALVFLSSLLIGIIRGAPVNPCAANQYQYNGVCQPNSCLNYTGRIGTTAAGTKGNGTVPLNTQGSISNTAGTVTVTVQFVDTQNDGVFQADNPASCIIRTLLRTNAAYQTLGLNELPITSTYDASSGYRLWSFTLTPNQYASMAFPFVDTITGLTWYQGYFAYQFNISGITQYTYFFTFKFAVNSSTGATSGNATFLPLTTYQQLACSSLDNCVTSINATMGFTTSLSTAGCGTATSNITSYLNANLFICYSIPQFSNWTLANPFVYFTGDKLFLQVNIVNVIITKGVMVLQVKVPFVYNNVAVQVTATAVPPSSRLLNLDDPFPHLRLLDLGTPSSSTTSLGCIKVSSSATSCPTDKELAQYPPSASTTTTNSTPPDNSTNPKTANAKVLSLLGLLIAVLI